MMRYGLYLLCFLCVQPVFAQPDMDCLTKQCIAVVDAGSTGSRIHIFSYVLNSQHEPSSIQEVMAKKITPGFAAVELNQPAVNAYLEQLMSNIPTHAPVPLYFYATGGMRLKPEAEQKQRYAMLQQWFSSQTQWALKEGKTISGQQEGLYDWLSVNYQLGVLGQPEAQTAGVMDMGGASVQIAFALANPDGIKPEDTLDVHLYGQHYTLFSHSFLGLGQNEMQSQFKNEPSCFSADYALPNGMAAQGDAWQCEQQVAGYIQSAHQVASRVQPAREGSLVKDWYVLGGVVNMVSSKPYVFENAQFTNLDMISQGDASVCHQPWSVLHDEIPNDPYLYGFCFNSAYFYALMVEGYGLPSHIPIHFLSDKHSADWTMGVVLNNA